MVILEATTTEGHRIAVKLADPPTADDLDRLATLCAFPGMAGAEWTGRYGENVR